MPQGKREEKRERGSVCVYMETSSCLNVQFPLVSHIVKRDNAVILKHLEIWG